MQPQLSCPSRRANQGEPDSSAFGLLQLICVYASILISGCFHFTHFQFLQRQNAALDSRDIPRIRGLSSSETPPRTVFHLKMWLEKLWRKNCITLERKNMLFVAA